MMKHIYIFIAVTRGVNYGIGTYIDVLLMSLRSCKLKVTIVELDSFISEVRIVDYKSYRAIKIPYLLMFDNNGNICPKSIYYSQNNIAHVLADFITFDEHNVFVFNFLWMGHLAEAMKKYFNGTNVSVVHYTDWSFRLKGNKKTLIKIINKPEELRTQKEQDLYESFCFEKKQLDLHSDKVIVISRHSYNDIISLYKVDKGKVYLIPHGLRDKYRPLSLHQKQTLRNKYRFDDREKLLIFAGRLEPVKGVDFLIKAFQKVLKKHSECRLIIAGNGEFERLIPICKNDWSKITFLGFVDKRTLFELYSIATLGVVPSLHEEFGFVCLEMIMFGLPVIVNNTTGLCEIIEDNIDGMYADIKSTKVVQSVDDLAKKILYLIDNSHDRIAYSKKGRKKFLKKYNYKLFTRTMKSFFESC